MVLNLHGQYHYLKVGMNEWEALPIMGLKDPSGSELK